MPWLAVSNAGPVQVLAAAVGPYLASETPSITGDSSLASIALNLLYTSPAVAILLGILFALFKGWLVLGKNHQEKVAAVQMQLTDKSKEADAWKGLYEKSQETLGEIRQALFIAQQRADTANDMVRVSNKLLEAIQAGGGHAAQS